MNKITKADFIKEFKNHVHECSLQLRKAHKLYGSEVIPTFTDITSGSNQPSQDLTKALNPIILNFVYGYIDLNKGGSSKCESNGLDLNYHGKEIEAKCAYAKNGILEGWVGNKTSNKVPLHLLIGYSTNNETIDGLFVALVDLSKTKDTKWSYHSSAKSAYAHLKVNQSDNNNIHVLIGSRKKMQKGSKNQYFLVEKI